ncbi:MAG: N-acetylmuramoyl-L-alanine amidase [Proteobacteria bacterium]|nr:MAG: N-acetylmuramoyl-L-alanine amidase [Pseudomonadota bacterium]
MGLCHCHRTDVYFFLRRAKTLATLDYVPTTLQCLRTSLIPLLAVASALGAPAPVNTDQFKVVLDPGHGGNDLGAVSSGTREKDFTLGLALELKRQLLIKKYQVILTRDADRDVSLKERTKIANREKAQLFLSIHLNSPPPGMRGSPEGVETYILNTTSDQTSKRLAELENKGLDLAESETENHDVNLILKDLTLDSFQPENKRLACLTQRHLISVTKQKHRGIRQALFVVLLGAEMPSALVEVGFISSERDRTLLQKEHGLRAVAASLVRAIEEFRMTTGSPSAKQILAECPIDR